MLFQKICCLLLAAACVLSADTIKLYLKDSSYQMVREYHVEGDRVRLYSTDRDEWEEMPAALVDLEKTKAEISERETIRKENEAANAAKDQAERARAP